MDQYLMYGEEYEAVRDAVAKAVVDGDVDQIEEACEVFLFCYDVLCTFFQIDQPIPVIAFP